MIYAMDISSFDPQLRAALDFPDGTLAGNHFDLVEAVRAQHPHDVRFLLMPPPSTCGMYALGLTGDPTYHSIALDLDVFAGVDFFNWLLATKIELTADPVDDCLALYFANGDWKHVGIMRHGRVQSKWGLFPVYGHPIPEVPARYGDMVRFSARPVGDVGMTWFLEYARHKGVPDEYLCPPG